VPRRCSGASRTGGFFAHATSYLDASLLRSPSGVMMCSIRTKPPAPRASRTKGLVAVGGLFTGHQRGVRARRDDHRGSRRLWRRHRVHGDPGLWVVGHDGVLPAQGQPELKVAAFRKGLASTLLPSTDTMELAPRRVRWCFIPSIEPRVSIRTFSRAVNPAPAQGTAPRACLGAARKEWHARL